jgi:phosphoribosylformylglycinamidine cyclo-ligase
MCANDIVVAGAEPLFFLDYYATGRLNVDTAATLIEGIAKGCEQAGAALVGGETAEMPGLYDGEDYDLAGFCVGIVEKDRIIDGSKVAAGDALIGLAASGPHSNGYSLIRKILKISQTQPSDAFGHSTLGETLLAPTRIYVRPLLELMATVEVHALAHITGGGLPENLPRVLPSGTRVVLEAHAWQRPAIFDWLQAQGQVTDAEMYRTFNCGIGMVICVAHEDLDNALKILRQTGETAWPIGTIEAGDGQPRVEIR